MNGANVAVYPAVPRAPIVQPFSEPDQAINDRGRVGWITMPGG